MKENYTRLLVTKLNQSTHERLKELAKQERRTLSAMSRIIIEDHITETEKVEEQ
jgi:predicted DNA-binding protein